MNTSRFGALHVGASALGLLLVLQILWHAWLLPPSAAQRGPTLALAVVPLLPGLWACISRLHRGVLIGGIVCLFYFCHGVGVAYADPRALARALGTAEIALSLVVIGSLGWHARSYRRERAA